VRPQEEVLRAYDERSKPGTDLLDDGSFEESQGGKLWHWVSTGASGLLQDENQSHRGHNSFRLGSGGSVRQEIALPLSMKSLQVGASLRGTIEGKVMPFRWNVIFRGFEPLSGKTDGSVVQNAEIEIKSVEGEFKVDTAWKGYSGDIVAVPPQARWAVLWMENNGPAGEVLVDDVSLHSRP
jgi:hypothetical protein